MAQDPNSPDQPNLREQVFSNLGLDENDLGDQGEEDVSDTSAAEGGADAEGDDSQGGADTEPSSPEDLDIERLIAESERGGEQQPEGKQAPQQPAGPPSRYDRDNKGNILDPKTGQVIARAGAEARLYVDARNARIQAHQASLERDRLHGHLQEAVSFIEKFRTENRILKEAHSSSERLGVTPQETAAAVELVSKLKRGGTEAVNALKEILTRAATAGIDVQSLGVGGGGIDTKTLVDLIDQKFAPIRDHYTAQQQAAMRSHQERIEGQQRFQNAAEHTVAFFQSHPDATPYAPAIERMLRAPQFQGWSLREVWQAIQLHLSRTKGNGAAPPPPNGQSNHREIPRGQSRVDMAFDASRPAPISMSYEDIVDEVMTAAGMPR